MPFIGALIYSTRPSGCRRRQAELLFLVGCRSIADSSTPVEVVRALKKAPDQLYQELGINPLLSTYGQIGDYEPIYKSFKYVGFIYCLDSLRRLGIGNIELKEGEWHPERHAAYPEVYEVTYP